MKDTSQETELKKALGLKEATIYGVGVILGAGIYALLGEAAGIAGNATWISFVLGAFIAAFTALSYAELCSIFPRTAAEFVYVKNSTGSKFLAFLVEYTVLLSLVFSAAAVSFGFAGYFNSLFGFEILYIGMVLILALTILNFKGIQESANFNIVATLIEAGGLVLIILLGLSFVGSVDYLEVPSGAVDFSGMMIPIIGATVLVFFAYQGFEELANLTEETKDAARNIPKAMLIALGITTILYILVSVVAVSVVHYSELGESAAPLSLIAEKAGGPGFKELLGVIALFATANTVLVLLISASRMLYGMAKQKVIPKIFGEVHAKTPVYAILFTTAIALGFMFFVNSLSGLALLTNMAIFISFFSVNASLILLRIYKKELKGSFRTPLNIGNIPITAVLGCFSSLVMLPQLIQPMEFFGFEIPLLVFGGIIIAFGMPLYYIGKSNSKAI